MSTMVDPIAPAETGRLDPSRLRAANLHPETGFATDYLNRFNEAVMLLELIQDDPSCAEDLADWQPANYVEHFTQSGFKAKDLAHRGLPSRAAPVAQPARCAGGGDDGPHPVGACCPCSGTVRRGGAHHRHRDADAAQGTPLRGERRDPRQAALQEGPKPRARRRTASTRCLPAPANERAARIPRRAAAGGECSDLSQRPAAGGPPRPAAAGWHLGAFPAASSNSARRWPKRWRG